MFQKNQTLLGLYLALSEQLRLGAPRDRVKYRVLITEALSPLNSGEPVSTAAPECPGILLSTVLAISLSGM